MFDFEKGNLPKQKDDTSAETQLEKTGLNKKQIDKYQPSNLAKTFLIQYNQSSSDSDEDRQANMPKQQQVVNYPKRSKKSKLIAELTPLIQGKSTIVYQKPTKDSQKHSQQYEAEKIIKEEVSVSPINLKEKAQDQFENIDQVQREKDQTFMIGLKQQQFLLYDQQQSSNTNKSSQDLIELPSKKKMLTEFYSSSSQKSKSRVKQTDSSNKKHRKNHIIRSSLDFISTNNLVQVKKLLNQPLKQNNSLQLILNRNKDGFNVFWPQFYLQFQSQTVPLIVAKKVSSKPTTTYIISTNPSNFEENSQYYLGKIKSSLLGDINNLFGQGLSPTSAKQANQVPRQLLATIIYSKLSTSKSKPRQFQVFVKKPEYRYYLNFNKVRMYEQEIDFGQLHKQGQNNGKIDRFYNKKPVYDEQNQAFRLNFRGKAECSSIKNFILQKEINGQNIMMFGKINESKFNVEISYPLSPLIGFAVALSSFDSRLFLGD